MLNNSYEFALVDPTGRISTRPYIVGVKALAHPTYFFVYVGNSRAAQAVDGDSTYEGSNPFYQPCKRRVVQWLEHSLWKRGVCRFESGLSE